MRPVIFNICSQRRAVKRAIARRFTSTVSAIIGVKASTTFCCSGARQSQPHISLVTRDLHRFALSAERYVIDRYDVSTVLAQMAILAITWSIIGQLRPPQKLTK